MDVLEYCKTHHLRDDLDLHLRLCRFCKIAMCQECFDVHKNHCSGQTQTTKRNAIQIESPSGGPRMKKLRTYEHLQQSGTSNSSPPYHSSEKRSMQRGSPISGNKQVYPSCPIHSLSEDQFCVSHCKLICQKCHVENHATCTVKFVTSVCETLDHTAVTEYKKWLNSLRVNSIEIKTFLGRNLESIEKHKISALSELQCNFSKANENLNQAFVDAKSEIEKTFDTHSSEIWAQISQIEGLNTKLEGSLKDAGILEGSKLDAKLFLKLLEIIERYSNVSLPAGLKALCGNLRKVKFSFNANIRYQPLSTRSNIGRVNTVVTKFTPVNPALTSDISLVFSKLSNGGGGCLRAITEKDKVGKTDETQEALTSRKTSEANFTNNTDPLESETVRREFVAAATGQYALSYVKKIQNGQSNPDTIDTIKTGTKQNNNKVVVLNGSPYVLVPYKPQATRGKETVFPSDKHDHTFVGSKQDNNHLADTCTSRQRIGIAGVERAESLHNTNEQLNPFEHNDKANSYMSELPEQPNSQTRACIQNNLKDCEFRQNRTLVQTSDGNANSPDLDTVVPQVEINKENNALESTSNVTERQNYFTAEPGSENVKGNPIRSEKVVMEAMAGEGQRVPMAMYPMLSENLSYYKDAAVMEREQLDSRKTNIAHDCLMPNDLNVPRTLSELTKPATKIHKLDDHANFDALIEVASSIRSSLAKGNGAVNEMPQESHASNSNVANMTETCGSTICDTNGTTDIANLYNWSQYDGSEFRVPSVKAVKIPLCTDQNIQALGQLESSHFRKANDLMVSNVIASYTRSLPGPSYSPIKNQSNDTTSHAMSNDGLSDNVQQSVSVKRCPTKNEINSIKAENAGKLNIKDISDKKRCCITGIDVTSDGRIIMVDFWNKKVKMIPSDRKGLICLPLEELCRDVTFYNDTTAVVTGDRKLFFIDISGTNLSLAKTVELDFYARGIQTYDKNLLVTCCGKWVSVDLIDIAGHVLWSVSEDQRGQKLFKCFPDGIACYKDQDQVRVVVVDFGADSIIALDGNNGNVVRKCTVKEKRPLGVTVDSKGNFYLCYYYNAEIAVWNRNLTRKRILTRTRKYPKSIAFDAYRNQLLVWSKDADSIECFQLS